MLTAQTSFLERYRRPLLLLTAAWTAIGVAICVWVPLLVPALLLLSPVAPVAWYAAAKRRPPPHKPSAIILALILAGAYLTLNASWSLSPAMTHITLAFYFLFVLAMYLTCNTLPHNDADVLRAMEVGLCAGLAIGSAVLLFEIASQQLTHRALMSLVPALRPKPRDMILENGWVIFLESYLINRNVTAMTFLFWPAALAIALAAPPARLHRWLARLVPVAAAVLASKHATSKVALLGAAATFAAFQVSPAATRRVIAWAWAGTILLVVPLATLAYHSQLYLSDWIPRSAQHRIVIWGYTSKQIANAPILGSGINTARALNDPDGYDVPLAPGSDFKLTTSLHSHNVYLQAWYETGAVGALLLLGIGLLVLRTLAGAPREIQSYLYATFVTCALLGGASFSLWQPWFMASFGFAAGFASAGYALAERSGAQSGIAPGASASASARDCESHSQP